MTDERLAELRRLCEGATPGPWETDCVEDVCGPFFHYRDGGEIEYTPGWKVRGPLSLGNHELDAITEADAAFVAAARTAVPELLAEVDRLRAALAADRERVAAWFAPHPAGGRWCRLADHQQGACDCAEIAAAIRGGVQWPTTG